MKLNFYFILFVVFSNGTRRRITLGLVCSRKFGRAKEQQTDISEHENSVVVNYPDTKEINQSVPNFASKILGERILSNTHLYNKFQPINSLYKPAVTSHTSTTVNTSSENSFKKQNCPEETCRKPLTDIMQVGRHNSWY